MSGDAAGFGHRLRLTSADGDGYEERRGGRHQPDVLPGQQLEAQAPWERLQPRCQLVRVGGKLLPEESFQQTVQRMRDATAVAVGKSLTGAHDGSGAAEADRAEQGQRRSGKPPLAVHLTFVHEVYQAVFPEAVPPQLLLKERRRRSTYGTLQRGPGE